MEARKYGWALWLVLSWHLVQAQRHQFQRFDELSGIPSSETYQVFQDSRGFIWIATDNGVARFDGSRFAYFNSSNGLLDNTVFGFHEDTRGRIWFRTFSGTLFYCERDSVKRYKHHAVLRRVLNAAILTKIEIDHENTLYFSASVQGMAGAIDSTGQVIWFERPASSAVFITETKPNHYFFGNSGLLRNLYNIKINDEVIPFESVDSLQSVSPVICQTLWQNELYFAIGRSLFHFKNGQLKRKLLAAYPIISLSVDRQNQLWVGFFGGGVRRFQRHDFSGFFQIDDLGGTSVSSTWHDDEGGYWFSTLDRGVFYFPNLSITSVALPISDKVTKAVRFTDSQIVYGNYAGEVKTISREGTISMSLECGTIILGLFVDEQNRLWVSTGQGNYRMALNQKIVRVGAGSSFRGLYQDHPGFMWGYGANNIFQLDTEGRIIASAQGRKRPAALMPMGDKIYVGGLYGLERYDADLQLLDKEKPFIEARISSLTKLNDRCLLAGSVGEGLYLIEDDHVFNLNEQNQVTANTVYDMLDDGKKVWLGTDQGIFVSSKLEVLLHRPQWKRLTRSSGLVSDKNNFLVSLADSVWAFSDSGISIIPQSNTHFALEKSRFYIQEFKVNDRAMPGAQQKLASHENNITIKIGAINFNHPFTTYRHRINSESSWNYSAGDAIAYFAMQPGVYTIEVEATTNQVQWTPVSMPLRFEISPPWSATWWFRLLLLAVVAGVAYVAYRIRLAGVRRKHQYLELVNTHQTRLINAEIQTQERERKRIATDLHDGVGTALTSVKMLITDSIGAEDKLRDSQLRVIGDTLTEVIADLRRIIYDLHPPALERYGLQAAIKNLVEKINDHGGLSVKYDYYGQREVSPRTAITIYRIIQELINNTLKHAKATEIRIQVNHFEMELNVMYEDNGIGMVGRTFGGLGLHSIESRVKLLDGRMNWESNHKGTFYNFDIPY